ncbi:MAG: tetratricopeptide repeat protein [Planctomycetota bacterium]|nr:tetratricopeptide repeat protein [Planctomycetota bacterium]
MTAINSRLPRSGRFSSAAVVLLGLIAAAATCTYVQSPDVFWHLAGGEWMLTHGKVLNFDPFGVEASPRWVNVHWLFQLIIAAVHILGGFSLLTVLKVVLASVAAVALGLSLRREAPPAWLLAAGGLAVVVMADRIRVRPEAFTLVFLTLTVVMADSVRRGGRADRLWWLVPIMLVWVNMHGLYFLGPVTAWLAVLGALLDRRLGRGLAGNLLSRRALKPIIVATAVCALSPWPVDTLLHPLLLAGRISGQQALYRYGVAEFQPAWQALSRHPEAVVLAVLTVAAVVVNIRSAPAGHLFWLAVFTAMGAVAVRNLALLGPVCGFLLVLHGAATIRRIVARQPALNVAAMVLAAAAITGYATEWTFRIRGQSQRFGAGLHRDKFAIDAAKFLGRLDAEGDILCENFGDGGVFIYYARPRRRVWMDGRLELHSAQRLERQQRFRRAFSLSAAAELVKLPETVRFIVVRHNSRRQLAALSQSRRFKLIYLDPAAAVFARTDWRRGSPAEPELDNLDRPLQADGLLAGLGARRRRWWRQNPSSLNYQIGRMLLALRGCEQCTVLAVRYLTAANTEGLADTATARLGRACQLRARQTARLSAYLPANIYAARVAYLARVLGKDEQLSAWPKLRLAEIGIEELRKAEPNDTEARMMLGDLLLRTGRPAEARKTYASLRLAEAKQWKRTLRTALCDWAEGKVFAAIKTLETLNPPEKHMDARAVEIYRRLIRQEIGCLARGAR